MKYEHAGLHPMVPRNALSDAVRHPALGRQEVQLRSIVVLRIPLGMALFVAVGVRIILDISKLLNKPRVHP